MRKRLLLALLAALVPILLSGCMLTSPVEELYALPQLPEEYQKLSAQIEEILASGAEYTAPTSGTNLQSVQLEDLDGDGDEEALAFFRTNSDGRPLRIYIFQAMGEGYQQAAVIEGSGTSIYSIHYEDMNGDGVKEILVSWQFSTGVQAMEVYVLEDLEPVLSMSTPYARYEVMDLDSDDIRELVVLRGDETESGGSLADYYDWDGSGLVLRSTEKLSMTIAELQWMEAGTLQNGETAVFVTGRVIGVEETSRAITDILVYRDPDLTNIVLDDMTGVSSQISRFLNLQPTDINGDGVTEVPMPAELPAEGEDAYWKIYWYSYSPDGAPEQQTITYHNLTDSWYLLIPESWDNHFTVRQSSVGATERATTFYSVAGRQIGEELLTIYTITGNSQETQAALGGRTILRRQANTVYAVQYTEYYEKDWRYAVSQEQLAESFNPILTQWSTGEE